MAKDCQIIVKITFYLKGTYRNYNAALDYGRWLGFNCYETENTAVIALRQENKSKLEGIIFSDDFKRGIVQIQLFK